MNLGFLTSLRGKIVATVGLLVVAGLLGLSITNVLTARSYALESLGNQTRALSHSHAAGVGDWVASRQQVVKSFAGAVPEADPIKFLQQAKIAGDVDTAYIGYADKRTAFSSPQTLPPDYDPTSRPWYQLAAKAAGPVVTEPYLDAGTKKLVITFASAVKEGAQVSAVTALDVFMDGVVRNVASIRPTPGTYGFIVAKDGKIVVHEDTALVLKPVTDIAPTLGSGGVDALVKAATLSDVMIRGENRLVYAAAIPGTDWTLLVALNRQEAMGGIVAMVWSSAVWSVVIAVLAILVIGAVLSKVLGRLVILRNAMQDIGSGEGDLTRRIATTGTDELATIASGFNQFVEKTQNVLRQVRSSADNVALASAEIALRTTQEKTGMIQPAGQVQAIISNVALLKGTIATKEVQLNSMRTFAAGENPDLLRAKEELRGLQAQLAKLERNTSTREGDSMVPTGMIPQVGVEYVRKMRDVKYYETIFELLAKQFELAKIDEAKDASLIQVLDKALPAERKSGPKRLVITLASLIAGAVLAFVLAFAHATYTTLRRSAGPASRP